MLDPAYLLGKVLDGSYRLVRFIGQGGTGYVYQAEELLLGERIGRCAVKLVRCATTADTRGFLNEVKSLAWVDHRCILRFRGGRQLNEPDMVLKGCLCLTTELADDSLEKMLGGPPMPQHALLQVARSVAEALAYLHARTPALVHRDVRPGNVFRVGTLCKLGDLGLTQTIRSSVAVPSCRRGLLRYAAPELFESEVGTFCDVWSFGMLLQELLTGRPAYEGLTEAAIVARAVSGTAPDLAGVPAPYDEVIAGCLRRDPQNRWTMMRVLQHLHP